MGRYLLLIIVGCCFIFACESATITSKKEVKQLLKSTTYQPTILPEDINKLWLSEGNPASDTVYIISQGGPKDSLYFQKNGRVIWRYLPKYNEKHIVHLHQAQTYNPKIFEYQGIFTSSMAQKEIDLTALMINKAIQHFKSKGKYVVVIGHSYGSFCILQAMTKDNKTADKYLISAGRIEDNPASVKTKLAGINGGYKEDGTTLILDDMEAIKNNRTTKEQQAYRIKQILKGTLGQTNYYDKMKDIDLSNATFVYSKNDNRVGKLTQPEIDFLASKNAQIIATTGDHGDVIKRTIDAVMSGQIEL